MNEKRNHGRAAGKTHINISLSEEEVRLLDELAAEDDRSRSYIFRKILREAAKRQKRKTCAGPSEQAAKHDCPLSGCGQSRASS